MSDDFITLEDMFIAYRKVKVDLFYAGYYSPEAIIEYENSLEVNLKNLYKRIISGKSDWIKSKDFLGGWYYIPKAIAADNKYTSTCVEKSSFSKIHFTNPAANWNSVSLNKKIVANFRVIADVSLDFHILAELWILKIGHLFDSKLADCSYGNRLRRLQNEQISQFSLGTFKPYLKAYRDWKNDALNAINDALEHKKKVVTITGDISSFYHSLNPDFLTDPDFLTKIGIDFSKDKLYNGADLEGLNALFVAALEAWQELAPGITTGLPVGVPASSLVANAALWEFDKIIREEITPIHFGRYVDDIILVIDNAANIVDVHKIWEKICRHFNQHETVLQIDDDGIKFCPSYLKNSSIYFKNSKNKIFIMEGETGINYVRSIQNEIAARSSEWRAMPQLDDTDIAFVSDNLGEKADNLRSADGLIIKKAAFSIKLRNMESLNRNLLPQYWNETRHGFLHSCIEHIFVLPNFFDYFKTISRIIRLATVCEDFDILVKILKKCSDICLFLHKTKTCSQQEYNYFVPHLVQLIQESIISAFPLKLSKNGKENLLNALSEMNVGEWNIFDWNKWLKDFDSIQKNSLNYYLHDIGMQALKCHFIGKENNKFIVYRKDIVKNVFTAKEMIPGEVIKGIELLFNAHDRDKLPLGVIFATRPLSLLELYIRYSDVSDPCCNTAVDELIFSLRGFMPAKKMPQTIKGDLKINDATKPLDKVGIATACWKTDDESWMASIQKKNDPDKGRYQRFSELINDVLRKGKDCHYFIMPELSVPFEWFLTASLKLKKRGISFIAGVEYNHTHRNKISNKVWASLLHDSLGFPALMLYSQDKQTPALHEKREIKRLANKDFCPDIRWKTPPIIQHGNLFFSILICSELTNIAYRSFLRGKIDILFVSAWNQDLETFNALIESAALDIHCYVVECNDRAYGDTRIRCPHKDSWSRDILRTKGGACDYLVTAIIDVELLRRFQSSYDSPSKPFKPVPDGFKIAFDRKALPLKDK